jgi:2-dehydropantoate 2-reductase
MSKTIYVIGAGAIGKALAVFLHQAKQPVVLIHGREGQTAKTETLTVKLADQSELKTTIEILPLDQFKSLDGLVVLTSKSFGNQNLADTLKSKMGSTPIAILQNGLGVERPFLDAGFKSVYRCVLFATSQFTNATSLTFKPVSVSPVGTVAGQANQLDELVKQISTPWFSFRAESNIQYFIWKKAIANSVFNSICPLLDIDNGIFHRDAQAKQLAARVVKECVAVVNASGIELTEEQVMENILLISQASDGQLISTLQDIKNKRPTEIDTLNFEIVRHAHTVGLGDQVPETKLLGEMVRLRSLISLKDRREALLV